MVLVPDNSSGLVSWNSIGSQGLILQRDLAILTLQQYLYLIVNLLLKETQKTFLKYFLGLSRPKWWDHCSLYQTVSARTQCGLSGTAGTWWGCCQALETDTICVRQNHAGTTCSILETEIEHLKRRWSRTWVSSGDTEKTWDWLRIIFLAR